MTNEVVVVIKILLSLSFVQVIFRWNKAFLYVAIVLNLLLVSIFGAKLISVFGFVTNNGNVFYATVFFAIQLITEQYGKKEAYKGIWIGACSMVFFMLMAQFTLLQAGLPQTSTVNLAIDELFKAVPRIALASVLAFVVSQFVNISLFSYLYQKTAGKALYLRVNASNIVGQFVDSVLFFVIAFYGTAQIGSFLEIFIVGYILKVCIGVLTTPFFYLSTGKLDQ